MVWRAGLMAKVKTLGINDNMFAFINDFIHERTFQVRVGADNSTSKVLQNGTPQGSVISPILFLIMINDIKVVRPGVELSLFADDSATYKAGKNINTIMSDLQGTLDDISDWSEKWGLKISLTKSCGVIFTNKTKYVVRNPLKIAGKDLKMETKVKFLGRVFDSKLS